MQIVVQKLDCFSVQKSMAWGALLAVTELSLSDHPAAIGHLAVALGGGISLIKKADRPRWVALADRPG